MSVKKNSLHLEQAGIASLLFSMIMMIVITLIVLSFAQLTRRGQREALDSQLSAQAYYAAESGVNDAMQVVAAAIRNGGEANNPGCGLSGNFATSIPSTELTPGVSYTCLRVDTTPNSLLASLSVDSSKVLNLTPQGDMDTLHIQWKAANNTLSYGEFVNRYNQCPEKTSLTGDFTTFANWKCPYGILRFDLVPTSGSLSRKDLLEKTMTVYAVPSKNVTSGDGPLYNLVYASNTQQGIRAAAKCAADNSGFCELNISGFPAGVTSYAMRVTSKYVSVPALVVRATDDASEEPLPFKNSQAVIDVTGKAQDVLRRIEVHIPLGGTSGAYSDYAIESADSICKRFNVNQFGYKNGLLQDNDSYFSDDIASCSTYAAP